MPHIPGGLSPEEEQRWIEDLTVRSLARWGEERTQANREAIEKAAHAVGIMMRLEFFSDEAPGFYLSDQASSRGSAAT